MGQATVNKNVELLSSERVLSNLEKAVDLLERSNGKKKRKLEVSA